LFRETVEAQRKALGEDANETTFTMHCLAHTLVMYAGKDGIPPADDHEIESLYRKALAASRKYGQEASWHAFDITVRLGEFLNSRRRYEEAEVLLQDAIKRLQSLQGANPEMGARLHQELNSVYQNWGKPERAAEAEAGFRELIRLEPNDSGRRHRLGDLLLQQGKLAEAANEYTEVIRLRPNEHGGYYALGSSYAFGGHWTKAAAAFDRAAELSPADLWSMYRWATLCFYTNDHDGYRSVCRTMLDRFGQTDSLHVADCTAKACSLSPKLAGDLKQVMRLADFIVTATEQEPARKWYEVTKGLVDYRARQD
jgi:tetratricopeptide (TPR) repeat protein